MLLLPSLLLVDLQEIGFGRQRELPAHLPDKFFRQVFILNLMAVVSHVIQITLGITTVIQELKIVILNFVGH